MKSSRTTLVLAGLFLSGLLGLWGLERAGVLSESQRRQRSGRVVPQLLDVDPSEIARVQISRGGQVLRFERRGPDAWQMTEPSDVAADPSVVETLLRNVKELRPSLDAGTLQGSGEAYGLNPPRAVVSIWRASDAPKSPTFAAVEVGMSLRGQTFVRLAGSAGIDVVESKLLAALDREASELREVNLLPLPTFQVTRLKVRRGSMEVQAERSETGRWRLTAPVSVPANGPKIESLLAACSAVRVLETPKGFVADNVADFRPYGLDRPEVTLSLTNAARPDKPLVLEVGKHVPNHPDRVFVRRADQDDVVWVSDRFLTEVPERSTAFRSQNITQIAPSTVTDLQIDALGKSFELHRERDSWELTAPRKQKADTPAIQALLGHLDSLQASEFLDPSRVLRPELDPPVMTIRLWQNVSRGGRASAGSGDESSRGRLGSPVLSLNLGRHDVLKKTVYGRLEGDDVILAIPDAVLEVLPRNEYAYQDRSVRSISPERIRKLTLADSGRFVDLEPAEPSSAPNQWRMTHPVAANADVRAVTRLLALLSDLRAEDIVGDLVGSESRYGLDTPMLTVSWEEGPPQPNSPRANTPPEASAAASAKQPGAAGWLKVGKAVPNKPGLFYAAVSGEPFVITLGISAIQCLTAEFHDTRVLSLVPAEVRRLVLRLPGITLAFVRRFPPRGEPSDWSVEPGGDASGVDLSRFNELIQQLSQLRAARFMQYEGPIPPATGLLAPRLLVEVHRADNQPPQRLRLGASQGPLILAATGEAATGPVFVLPGAAWEALIQSLEAGRRLPDDVFAP